MEFGSSNFRPPPLTPTRTSDKPAKPEKTRIPAGPIQARAVVPLYILIAINVVYFCVDFVPEVLATPALLSAILQVEPLATQLTRAGSGFVDRDASAAFSIVFAGLLVVVAHTRARQVALIGWLASIGLILSVTVSVLPPLLGSWSQVATSGVLALIIIAYAIYVASQLPSTATKAPARQRPSRWIIWFLLSGIAPLAVGRLLRGGDYSAAALPLAPEAVLSNPASGWFYLVGASAGLALWALIQVAPPWAGRKLGWPLVVLAVSVGGGLAIAGDIASQYAVG